MKLTVAILLLSALHVSAGVYSQSRITLNMQSTDIKKVLAAIEKKTSYRFLYNQSLLENDQRITINAVDEEVLSVVTRILQNTALSYELVNNKLIVLKRVNTIMVPAQVTGRVTDSTGSPIVGASVRVKGTNTGTSTDANGGFSLTVPDSAILVISSVGFATQEIPVDGQAVINVTLVSSTSQLDQVVVVGYGVQRKRDLTGSVASVKGSDLAKQPVLTATQAVQGRVAGVQVISSGAPNSLPTVRIRGTGTMLAGANPLYVVDGVITDDIRNINSADIVNMDILKDASATAIYGMRAANGVLLITTKKGRTGKMAISYDASVGVREATNLVDMAGPNQYAGYLNEASVYYGSGDSLVPASKLSRGIQTDWFDAILRKGIQQNHNLSLSGGSDKITYFLSAGYVSEQGILERNKFNRFTLRSNNEYKITKSLKLSTLVSYSRADLDDVDANVLNNAYRAAPYVPAMLNGKYGNTSAAGNVANPLLQLDKKYNKGLDNRVQGTFAFEYKPISWLTLRSSMGIDLDFYKKTEYNYKYLSDTVTFVEGGGNQQQPQSSLIVTSNEASKWVWDNTATFAKTFGKHNLTVLAGMTSEQYKFNSLVGSRREVPENKDQWFLNTGSTTNATNANTGDKWTRNSYIGRVNYGFDDRYLLTATIRADGTSRFGADNRWGYFPSVGAGWNISSEGFMKDQQIFDNLKLRGSWGRVGNDGIPTSLYYTLATLNVPYYFGSENLGISFNDISDANIKWEITEEYDLGLEFTVLNRRLSGEIDYYHKRTNDALVEINIAGILPDQNGVAITNAASFVNKGVELSLNWNDKINNDLSYSIGGNIAYNKNEIVGLNGGQALFAGSVGGQGNTTKSDNGQPIGSFFLWQADGIFQNAAEIAASAQKDAKPGDLRYRDISGPQGKPDGLITDLDRTFVGAYLPKVTYGFNGTLNYKEFDFSLNAYGTAGGKIYNGKKATRGADARDNIEADVAKNRWTPNRTNTGVPRATLTQLPASTYFLESGDFLRLNNLTIGYTLPKNMLSKSGITNLRVYLTGQNLLTITPYSGFTPELLPSGDRPTLNAGIELGSYPTVRTFAFGVNLGF